MLRPKLNLAVVAALLLAVAAPTFAQEDKFLAVLKSDAGRKEKSDACMMLSRVATKKSVPTLAPLLRNPELAHMARYALEPIGDPCVDVALREAMGDVKGRLLVGVIGSLGVRKDAKAVDLIAAHLGDADVEVARAAARSLGKIATTDAAAAIEAALPKARADVLRAYCEGLFRCAEAFADAKNAAAATAIYDKIRALPKAPHQVRTGALRGAVLTRGDKGLDLLTEALGGKEYLMFTSAARISMEMPGEAVTKALTDALGKADAGRQIVLLQTLGLRGDLSSGPALLAATKKGDEAVRVAAIGALGRLGYAPAITPLTDLALSGEGAVPTAARACLAGFGGQKGQAAVVGMLDHKSPAARALAIELVTLRGISSAVGALLKAAGDKDATVRIAALKALKDLATEKDLPALLDLLTAAKSDEESTAAEAALRSLASRLSTTTHAKVTIHLAEYGDLPSGKKANITRKVARLVRGGAMKIEASNSNFGDPVQGTPKRMRIDYSVNGRRVSKTVAEKDSISFTGATVPPAVVDAFAAAVPKAPPAAKLALLRLLRNAASPKALAIVREAAKDASADVKDTALRALCDWPTADALPDVAALAKNPPSPVIKILALRGYLRLAIEQEGSAAAKLASVKDALALADRDDEKRLALSALVSVPLPGALKLAAPMLDSKSLKEEACLTVVTIGEALPAAQRQAAAVTIRKAAKTTSDKRLAARANALLRQARS